MLKVAGDVFRRVRSSAVVMLVALNVTSCGAIHQLGCTFSSDTSNPSSKDLEVASRLKEALLRYRAHSSLPVPGRVLAVSVSARTATIVIARWNPQLPGGERTLMDQANDFRYAQVWQGLYDKTYGTKGECVRLIVKRGATNSAIEQHCWASTGPGCAR